MLFEKDIAQILLSQETIQSRVTELASQISRDYAGKTPLLVGILKGSFVFLADLVRQLQLPLTLEFISVSSYGDQATSTGHVDFRLDLPCSIAGQDVLLVEDILDSGNTLHYLIPELLSRHPASLKLCVLLDKPDRRVHAVPVDYVGFTIPDQFVVGYGLDYAQKYRNLPYLGILDPLVYS